MGDDRTAGSARLRELPVSFAHGWCMFKHATRCPTAAERAQHPSNSPPAHLHATPSTDQPPHLLLQLLHLQVHRGGRQRAVDRRAQQVGGSDLGPCLERARRTAEQGGGRSGAAVSMRTSLSAAAHVANNMRWPGRGCVQGLTRSAGPPAAADALSSPAKVQPRRVSGMGAGNAPEAGQRGSSTFNQHQN